MRWLLKILLALLVGGGVGALSFRAGIPMAVPIAIGAVLAFVLLIGAATSEEMAGRYRVYVIAALGIGLAFGALIMANPR